MWIRSGNIAGHVSLQSQLVSLLITRIRIAILAAFNIAGFPEVHQSKITYDTMDYVNDYDETVNANVLNEHANAANRYFHSLIAGHLK